MSTIHRADRELTRMNRCRWDRDTQTYCRRDGEPCRTDDYGDPTRHCTARRSCGHHIGPDELTCATCVGRTRRDVRGIVDTAALMPPEAEECGVNSEAANLAGPAADVEAWSWRKVAAKQGRAWHLSLLEDDDERHPYTVLCRWQMMLAEDYGHDLPPVLTTEGAAAYLDRVLARVAQDEHQDFPLLARELRRCRRHLAAVLRDSDAPERGAPCPRCPEPAPRLELTRGHWCEADDCERLHWPTDPDVWTCPRDREHAWTDEDYRRWVADVYDQVSAR